MRAILMEAKKIESLYEDLTRDVYDYHANGAKVLSLANDDAFAGRTDDEIEESLFDLIEDCLGDRKKSDRKQLIAFRSKWFNGRKEPKSWNE